jgi:hypothetical protein
LRDIVLRVANLQPDLLSLRRFAYLVAFMEGDTPTMARELESARRLPDGVAASDWQARTAAFAGRVRSAHDQFRRAVEAAARAQLPETAAQWSASESEMHALVGQCAGTRRETASALMLSRDNTTLERSGRALALCGERDDATKLSDELALRFPAATLTERIQRPVIAAALAIQGGDPARGLALLEPVAPYDHARSADFWPPYLRGLAYLAGGNGAEAGTQFEAILNHRGEAPDSILYPLSHLGAARAAALTGDTGKARHAYVTFLALWRDADPNLAPLQAARSELARLR